MDEKKIIERRDHTNVISQIFQLIILSTKLKITVFFFKKEEAKIRRIFWEKVNSGA